ncbi:hypothetical protein LA342_08795 [Campylobacter upsaliensis]|uniref:hypothetical protein n=1 Tax=Campylobacter upsaliensis TaxID=28080 RepID=UPI001CE13CEF|nr:hypothetical protein [Campylobacter upsaliensis]MCA5589855.1 hypothetical protein [Campylobacter upsaliensis]
MEHLAHEMEVYFSEIENFKVKLELFKEEMASLTTLLTRKKAKFCKALRTFKTRICQRIK